MTKDPCGPDEVCVCVCVGGCVGGEGRQVCVCVCVCVGGEGVGGSYLDVGSL